MPKNPFLSKFPEFRGELSESNYERWVARNAELFQGHHIHELGGDGMLALAAVDAGAVTAQVASEREEDIERVLDVTKAYPELKGKLGHVFENPVMWVLNYPRQFWRGVWFLDPSVCQGWDLPKVLESISNDRPVLVAGAFAVCGEDPRQAIDMSVAAVTVELFEGKLHYVYSRKFLGVLVKKFFGDDYALEFTSVDGDGMAFWRIARNHDS